MATWNCKAIIDRIASDLWDTSASYRSHIIFWCNEIQEEIMSELPYSFRRMKVKKLLPVSQEIINLDLDTPAAPTAAIASGGSLTNGNSYKTYVSFVIYDEDGKNYIESEVSAASAVSTADASNKTIDLTVIPTYPGDAATKPATIYRRIYMSMLASGGTEYGPKYFVQDITDNTTTTLSITANTTSVVEPVSATEIDQLASDPMIFGPNSKHLVRESKSQLQRYSPGNISSTDPDSFDYYGLNSIFLYQKLDSGASDLQRTLQYYVLRRPHEFFYDETRAIDLPIQAKSVLIAGVIARGYAYGNRDGEVSKYNMYQELKKQFINKITRQRGKPNTVRDVNGDTQGWSM
jgi:hypothetical protein